MKRLIMVTGLLMLTGIASADIQERTVTLSGNVGQGVLFMDESLDRTTAGIIVLHERWGLNDYTRNRARLLAEKGYVAIAVDLYGNGQVANHPDDAKILMEQALSEPEKLTARFNAAKSILRDQQYVDKAQLFAIGYGFGGGVALEQARHTKDLAGIANFHGPLDSHQPANKDDVQARVMVAVGQADPSVSTEQVAALVSELTQAGTPFQLLSFPDVQGSFTNPKADENGDRYTLPMAYDKSADRISWNALIDFIDQDR